MLPQSVSTPTPALPTQGPVLHIPCLRRKGESDGAAFLRIADRARAALRAMPEDEGAEIIFVLPEAAAQAPCALTHSVRAFADHANRVCGPQKGRFTLQTAALANPSDCTPMSSPRRAN